MKRIAAFLSIIILISYCAQGQTLQSPEQFLGYSLGTRFTRYDQVVAYFKSVAAAKPLMVKVEKYGETYEGRDLVVSYITSPENFQKLEAIRNNNLSLTGLLKDKTPLTNGAPAIVWLSYNVHGNEPASSEAAMKVLYSLVDPDNKQTKQWLNNIVVIMTPCLNPDGRDRYVNWYNSIVGKKFNSDPQSREHGEPWPQGRSNHYNFDLNRDWAWQTQVETQQLLKKYNEWMPQIHVDFHEQGYNQPYYFAPAAEPFHEVITPWQREFQNLIGKNNAKYFDANGWLYFTKQKFDLFYPSYGDTYPTYNGAIGMTFEQGGIRAGLGIKNGGDDTLTLTDRILHHYTTSLSTIEAASQNAQRLIDEFKKYFDDNKIAKNTEYKTYVLTSEIREKIDAVKVLLVRNGIQYGNINGKIKGYRYFTGKEEEAQLNEYSIAISAYQPKSILVKVLFEPKSKLSDSATYDITAWSIPYAYGVEGYALKEKKDIFLPAQKRDSITDYNVTYGYIIPYTSFNSTRVLAFLLKHNIKVRYTEKPFTYNHINYERGTLVVLKTSNSNDNWNKWVNEAVKLFNIIPTVVNSGFVDKGADFGSPDVHLITMPKVALFTGEQVSSINAGEIWNYFDQALDYPLTLLNTSELAGLNLKNYNVLILPDGYYILLGDKTIVEKLKEFVRTGGKLIAMGGAVDLLGPEWGLKSKEDKADDKKDDYSALKKYTDRERDDLPNSIPGAIYKVELDNTHPLAYGYPAYYYTLKQDAKMYEFVKEGWNVGVLKKDDYVTGFSGFKVKNKLKDGLLFGEVESGNGSFVFFADDPLFRMFWENGKMLFGNAVFLAGQ